MLAALPTSNLAADCHPLFCLALLETLAKPAIVKLAQHQRGNAPGSIISKSFWLHNAKQWMILG